MNVRELLFSHKLWMHCLLLSTGVYFNMIEGPSDHVGSSSHITVHGAKLAVWERLCMFFGLIIDDIWHRVGFVRERGSLCLRSDRCIGGTNLSLIDRFYISDWFGVCGDSVGILAGISMTGYLLVGLVVEDVICIGTLSNIV